MIIPLNAFSNWKGWQCSEDLDAYIYSLLPHRLSAVCSPHDEFATFPKLQILHRIAWGFVQRWLDSTTFCYFMHRQELVHLGPCQHCNATGRGLPPVLQIASVNCSEKMQSRHPTKHVVKCIVDVDLVTAFLPYVKPFVMTEYHAFCNTYHNSFTNCLPQLTMNRTNEGELENVVLVLVNNMGILQKSWPPYGRNHPHIT